MEPFRKNDVVRLDIERFGSAGEGVAHLPGAWWSLWRGRSPARPARCSS